MVEADGRILVRTHGSHRQFRHPSKRSTVTISGNSNLDMPRGTRKCVMKQAGLKE